MRARMGVIALDIWSAGVILLCILSGRYPFFNAPDDLTALAEIAAVCGSDELVNAGLDMGLYCEKHLEQLWFRCY
jgi:serine/threonine protein kinase